MEIILEYFVQGVAGVLYEQGLDGLCVSRRLPCF